MTNLIEMMTIFVFKTKTMVVKKYYVVWKGLKAGVFDNWKECEIQIKGVEGAVYKSFLSLEEAKKAFRGSPKDYIKRGEKKVSTRKVGNIDWNSWCVDAACSGNPGAMEYRGVDSKTGLQLFHKGPFPLGTNNIGEFLGIVHALALLKKQGSDIAIYSDSLTALKWVKDKAIKTKLPRNARTEELFDLVDRAIAWLKSNDYPNQVIKWETEKWGEIPADFGRK
jgi:ribonuclease HI